MIGGEILLEDDNIPEIFNDILIYNVENSELTKGNVRSSLISLYGHDSFLLDDKIIILGLIFKKKNNLIGGYFGYGSYNDISYLNISLNGNLSKHLMFGSIFGTGLPEKIPDFLDPLLDAIYK